MDAGSVAGALWVDAVEKGLAIMGALNLNSALAMSASRVKRTAIHLLQNVRLLPLADVDEPVAAMRLGVAALDLDDRGARPVEARPAPCNEREAGRRTGRCRDVATIIEAAGEIGGMSSALNGGLIVARPWDRLPHRLRSSKAVRSSGTSSLISCDAFGMGEHLEPVVACDTNKREACGLGRADSECSREQTHQPQWPPQSCQLFARARWKSGSTVR
jgi:hypothetical protein